ncbi:MAG TPA: hypothetical protein VIM30_15710 [Candidatus Limnocylindrales bacterium]
MRTALAKISSAVLTQTKGVEPAFQLRVNVSIVAMSCLTLPKVPRRMAWRVRTLNHVST